MTEQEEFIISFDRDADRHADCVAEDIRQEILRQGIATPTSKPETVDRKQSLRWWHRLFNRKP